MGLKTAHCFWKSTIHNWGCIILLKQVIPSKKHVEYKVGRKTTRSGYVMSVMRDSSFTLLVNFNRPQPKKRKSSPACTTPGSITHKLYHLPKSWLMITKPFEMQCMLSSALTVRLICVALNSE